MKKKPGPKPKYGTTMKRRIITLDEMTMRKAIALADAMHKGNFSEAVREAINDKYRHYQAL